MILLLSCLSTNIFVPFKYVFFLDCIIFKINPDKDQNTKTVPIIPIIIGPNIFSIVFKLLIPAVTFQYAYPRIQTAIISIITDTIGFFILIFSFFFVAVNKLINLYLEMVNVLKIITAKYIMAKYTQVFIQLFIENTNVYSVISASNNFATNIDIN